MATQQSFEDQLNQMLESMGQQIVQMGPTALPEILRQVVATMQAKAPRKTGRLQSSISYMLKQNEEYAIVMNDYGFYQNYGVAGYDSNQANATPRFGLGPNSLAPRGGWGTEYAFRDRRNPSKTYNYRRYGIRAKEFFDLDDVQTFVTQQLQQRANNIQP